MHTAVQLAWGVWVGGWGWGGFLRFQRPQTFVLFLLARTPLKRGNPLGLPRILGPMSSNTLAIHFWWVDASMPRGGHGDYLLAWACYLGWSRSRRAT